MFIKQTNVYILEKIIDEKMVNCRKKVLIILSIKLENIKNLGELYNLVKQLMKIN